MRVGAGKFKVVLRFGAAVRWVDITQVPDASWGKTKSIGVVRWSVSGVDASLVPRRSEAGLGRSSKKPGPWRSPSLPKAVDPVGLIGVPAVEERPRPSVDLFRTAQHSHFIWCDINQLHVCVGNVDPSRASSKVCGQSP